MANLARRMLSHVDRAAIINHVVSCSQGTFQRAEKLAIYVRMRPAMRFDELHTLLEYHYWARDRLLAAIDQLSQEQLRTDRGNSFPSIYDTLVHLYGADWIWLSRWEGTSPTALPASDQFPDLAALRTAWGQNEVRVRALVQRLGEDGIQRPMMYRGWDGKEQAQIFWQMFQHLVNHGSYHRGQITTMLRQIQVAPAKSMDLIAFYRERAALNL